MKLERMGILLAFAPFIAFAIVDRLLGSIEGLVAGTIVSAALLLRDLVTPGRTPKILEIGTATLFGAFTVYALVKHLDWSIMGVRLRVDLGLLALVVLSMAVRLPFTLQYAREQMDQKYWSGAEFIRTNYIISGVWALAFVVLVIADLILIYAPDVLPSIGIWATIGALIGAAKFTNWYPDRLGKLAS